MISFGNNGGLIYRHGNGRNGWVIIQQISTTFSSEYNSRFWNNFNQYFADRKDASCFISVKYITIISFK